MIEQEDFSAYPLGDNIGMVNTGDALGDDPPPLSLFSTDNIHTFKPFFSAFCKTSDENTRVQTHSLQTLRDSAREQERKCGGLKRRRRRRRIILVA